MAKILLNNKYYKEGSKALKYTSSWAKFAPGFFETMRFSNGEILFWDNHYNRMTIGSKFWKVKIPPQRKLEKLLLKLTRLNKLDNARLRIQFNASLQDSAVQYFAITIPLENSSFTWIKKGWKLGLYRKHYKSIGDKHIGFKSNNRNIYLLGKKWATKQGFDDALILNSQKYITDSTSCNLFWVKEGEIYTPPLVSGGVDGTFKKFLKSKQKEWGFKISEKKCTKKTLQNADEIFLTNVIRGFRWINEFEGKKYENTLSKCLYKKLKVWEQEKA